jgi:hypothetical protein
VCGTSASIAARSDSKSMLSFCLPHSARVSSAIFDLDYDPFRVARIAAAVYFPLDGRGPCAESKGGKRQALRHASNRCYRINAKLGAGGMGEVIAAARNKVAVKVLPTTAERGRRCVSWH